MLANAARRPLWLLGALFCCLAPGFASGQTDGCALSRAVVAGEIALRDTLSRMDGDAGALRAALSRLVAAPRGDGPDAGAALATYLASRTALADVFEAEGGLAARRLAREQDHRAAGQAALAATGGDEACSGQPSAEPAAAENARGDGGNIAGGHGGAARAGPGDATGTGGAAQPGGGGMATSPLSFLRDFNMRLHIAPAIGATLAFGALIFALTRDRRQHRRYLCHLPLVVEPRGGGAVESVLLDISQGGGKLTRSGEWGAGAALQIRLPIFERARPARVIWANEGFVGVSFRKALTGPEFQGVLRRARASGGTAQQDRR